VAQSQPNGEDFSLKKKFLFKFNKSTLAGFKLSREKDFEFIIGRDPPISSQTGKDFKGLVSSICLK
jgi:hypothetical protein